LKSASFSPGLGKTEALQGGGITTRNRPPPSCDGGYGGVLAGLIYPTTRGSLIYVEESNMIPVRARVIDSTHLELDAPIDAECGGKVFVVVTPSVDDEEKQQWLAGSSESLGGAYDNDEPEYTPSMVRERNPGYGA
jgi:hypothetical protein